MKSLEFNGNGTEYFKIWIVNLLLTIVTLGIYYPWAKVRSRRYFFGNTELDNANFEYHATGKQLFISYIIAMAIFATYIIIGQMFPIVGLVFALLFLAALPWIIWRSIKFNLRMISYRNVRFGFNGNLGGAYATFLAYPIGMIIGFVIVVAVILSVIGHLMGMQVFAGFLATLLILLGYPAFFAMINKISSNYLTNGSHFGQGQFVADLKFKPFFIIMLKGIGLAFLLMFLVVFVVSLLAFLIIGLDQLILFSEKMQNIELGAGPGTIFFVLIFSIYALLLAAGIYIKAYFITRHRSYLFTETTLDSCITFGSTLRANKLFVISFTNLLMIVFTLGLAYPWAAVRAYGYLAESIDIEATQGFDGYMSQQGSEGAIGEELGEAFDIDVGGVAF